MSSLATTLAPIALQCTHEGRKQDLCCFAYRVIAKQEREESEWWVRLCESMYRPNGQWRHR